VTPRPLTEQPARPHLVAACRFANVASHRAISFASRLIPVARPVNVNARIELANRGMTAGD
jgi:hypothetical protein